jgi:hypothetical protein
MRHINKKTTVQGAFFGSKPKPKPAVLNPPKIGGFKQIASYSVAEIIDLISDGPIDGLIDQNGSLLNDSIFKGIYLDNTPIQNTENLKQQPVLGELNISSIFKKISNIWITNDKFKEFTETPDWSDAGLFTGNKQYNPVYGTLTNIFANPSAFTFRSAFPLLWSLDSGNIEVHYNPREISSSSKAPNIGLSAANERIVLNFKNLLNTEISLGNTYSKEIAKKTLADLSKFENSIKVSRELDYAFFVLKFNGKLFNPKDDLTIDTQLSFDLGNISFEGGIKTSIFALPVIDGQTRQYTGNVSGVVVLTLPLRLRRVGKKGNFYYLNQNSLLKINSATSIYVREVKSKNITTINKNELYNFSNISCQFKDGNEFQETLNGFDTVRNDYYYDSRLFGPFITSAPIQRIKIDDNDVAFQRGIQNIKLTNPLIELDGSLDSRPIGSAQNNYSDWNSQNEIRDYDSISVTHTIENPSVKKVTVSISIGALSDTMHTDVKNVRGIEGQKLTAGAKIPTVISIRIETGKITEGNVSDQTSFTYLIAGLSEGGCVIDFGGDYEDPKDSLKESVKILSKTEDGLPQVDYLNRPFELPELSSDEDPTTTKRYVKIVKLSAETNSVLINKDISLSKVTEIIEEKLSYPFSSIVGLKIDATSFSSIPERSYDCRLKKIKIPNNYYPINDTTSIDKRYVKQASTYTPVPLYIGDWDGEFTEGWTDNPAWILYDILTSKRYGLGGYIDESQINKWELYKIARFCDAVDDDGYFIGVSDGVGGLEPRYSCNIIFKEQTKVYDAINVIANLFRGIVFFGGSEIHFLDDRPRTPIALFSNTNVRDGLFNYSNTRRDMQFNTVEVVYLDRFDNYKTKIEYIQDEADIRKRGVFKTTLNTSGVTSRAMARRIGQHIIYQTTKENQGIDFKAGLESLLCRPGDLIIVEDEMKTRSSNYGRILSVDASGKRLRIDNQFDSGNFTGFITIYTPTGYSTNADLNDIALTSRNRVEQFTISGDFLGNSSYSGLRGLYKFSGYTSGFENSTLPQEFPVYTGRSTGNTHDIFCYYNRSATGFVFATGRAFQDNNIYDKIITNTGVKYGVDIALPFTGDNGNYTGFVYSSTDSNKRGATSGQISGAIQWDQFNYPLTNGILASEIDTYNISQITKIALTGYDNLEYGSLIYLNSGDPNTALLPIVKEGSPYRIERKNASDQIYKIISIREENQNEYSITATKYDTGKFETIEKFITQDYLPQTYYTGINTIGSVDISELSSPVITSFTATNITSSNFTLSGVWSSIVGATGYKAELSNRITSENYTYVTGNSPLVVTGLTSLGNWDLSLIALGDGSKISSFPSKTGVFVAYTNSASNITSKALISQITIN